MTGPLEVGRQDTAAPLLDRLAVAELVRFERDARDHERWEEMAASYAPDSVVHISWFHGSGAEFVERSRGIARSGLTGRHRLWPSLVRSNGDRAIAETDIAVELRRRVAGVEVDNTAYARLLTRARRTPDGWRIVRFESIYQRDALVPVIPGTAPEIRPEDLEKYRPSYRFLSYLLALDGHELAQDLPGDDRPELAAAVRGEALKWLETGL
ncbi:nuclear transport factor 2 family protein [Lentzea sp. NPDC051213]|uniref:nuclear transport factor 2 family protein n=1 Tax=Lentzea sp. NPDC051213 TaxID=3364126 RepID=UPI0037B7DC42